MAHYAGELAAIDTPISETYIPLPDGSQSCADVSEYLGLLPSYLEHWFKLLANASHPESKINISRIINNLGHKQNLYKELQGQCILGTYPPKGPDGAAITPAGTTEAGEGGGGGWLWLLLAGAGVYLAKKKGLLKKPR